MRALTTPFRYLGRGIKFVSSWIILLPLWRKLWRWAGDVDDRNKAKREARTAEAVAAEETAAQAAGMTVDEHRWYLKELAKDEKDERKAAKEADAARKKSEKQEKDARSAASAMGISWERFPKFRSHYYRYDRMGRRGNLHKQELKKTARFLIGSPPVIVKKYDSIPPLSNAQELFAEDAKVFADHGYVPTSQSFAANNVLTGFAIGAGDLTVSYAKR